MKSKRRYICCLPHAGRRQTTNVTYTNNSKQNITQTHLNELSHMKSMFSSSNLSTDNYDTILNSWSQQDVKSDVLLGALGTNYCISEDARQSLINDHGWIITDEGKDCETAGIELNNKLNASIYPNPTSNILHIEADYYELKIVVIDMLGREIIKQYVSKNIDISHLEKGIYLIKLSDGLNVSSHKVIKN